MKRAGRIKSGCISAISDIAVVGDETYGGGKRRARNVKSVPMRDLLLKAQRQMLHAIRLEFTHPVTGAAVSATAPLPEDFRDLLERLDSLSQ